MGTPKPADPFYYDNDDGRYSSEKARPGVALPSDSWCRPTGTSSCVMCPPLQLSATANTRCRERARSVRSACTKSESVSSWHARANVILSLVLVPRFLEREVRVNHRKFTSKKRSVIMSVK